MTISLNAISRYSTYIAHKDIYPWNFESFIAKYSNLKVYISYFLFVQQNAPFILHQLLIQVAFITAWIM